MKNLIFFRLKAVFVFVALALLNHSAFAQFELCEVTLEPVSPLTFDPPAGSAQVSLDTGGQNCSWSLDLSGTASWLTVSPQSGTGAAILTFSVTANTSNTARTTQILVSGQGIQSYSISQNPCISSTVPTAISASPGTTVVSGTSVTLTASGGTLGTTVGYQWFTGSCGGSQIPSVNGNTITVSPTSTTTYYVRRTGLCGTTTCIQLTVEVCTPPVVDFTTDFTLCTNDPGESLIGTPTGGTFSSPTANAIVGTNFFPAIAGVGDHSVTYSYTDPSGCPNSITQTITVTGPPTAAISPSGVVEICQGDTLELTASGGVSYLWSTGATTQQITVSQSGTYEVTVTGANDCKDKATTAVSIIQPDQNQYSISYNNLFTFPASNVLRDEYKMTLTGPFGSIEFDNNENPSHSGSLTVIGEPTEITVYYWFVLKNLAGLPAQCTNTVTYTLSGGSLNKTVILSDGSCEDPQAIDDNFNLHIDLSYFAKTAVITPDGPSEFCEGGQVGLNASPTGAQYTYQWFQDDVIINGATNASYTATASGLYTIIIKDTDDCGVLSNAVQVTVNPNPASAVLELHDPSGGKICVGGADNLKVTIVGGTGPYTLNITGLPEKTGYNSGEPIPVSPLITTTYTLVSVIDANGCSATTVAGAEEIIVAENPSNATLAVSQNPICNGESTDLSVNFTGGASPYKININGVGIRENYVSGAPISVSPTANTTYTLISAEDDNGCPADNLSGPVTVIVNPTPTSATLSLVGSADICTGGSSELKVDIVGGTSPYSVVIAGHGTENNYISGTGINVSPTANTTYSLTSVADGNGCTPATLSGSPIVNVHPIPDVDPGTGITICDGDSFSRTLTSLTATNFSWTVAYSNGSISGATSGSGPTISYTLNNSGNVNGTATFTITPSNPGCSGPSETLIVTVKPRPEMIEEPDPPICNGGSVNRALAANVFGSTFTWTVTLLPGITGASNGSGTNINFTLFNSTNSPGTATFVITPTANGCLGTPETWVVTVNPEPDVIVGSDAPVCAGNQFSRVLTSNVSGTTFEWTVVNSPGVFGPTNGSGDTINYVFNTSNLVPGTSTFTITPKANLCTGPSKTLVITVNPIPVGSASDIIIGNTGTTDLTPTSTVSGTTYTWNVINLVNATATPLSGSSVPIAVTFNLIDNTINGTAQIEITPVANGCPGVPFTVNVDIISDFTVDDQVICENKTATLTANGVGVFKWYDAPTGGNLLFEGNPFVTPVLTTNKTYYVSSVFNTIESQRKPVTVTVNPVPNVAATNNEPLICSGAGTNITITNPNGITGTDFRWTAAAPAGVSGYFDGENLSLINQTLVNNTIGFVDVTYTITPFTATCDGTPIDVVVTVKPTPTGSASPAGETICSGESTNIVLSSTVSGATFSWTVVTDAGITGAAAGNVTSINQTLTNSSNTTSGTVTYTVIPTANSCPGAPFDVVVVVNPLPIANITNTSPIVIPVTGNVDLNAETCTSCAYQWNRNGAVITGATNPTYNATLAGSYTVTTTLNSCSSTSVPVIVSTETIVSVSADKPLPACLGDAVTLTADVLGNFQTSEYVYQWFLNDVLIINEVSSVYVPTVSGAYRVDATEPNGGDGPFSTSIVVTFESAPVINITNVVGTTCQDPDGTVSFNLSGDAGTYHYEIIPAGGTAPIKSGDIAPGLTVTFNDLPVEDYNLVARASPDNCQNTESFPIINGTPVFDICAASVTCTAPTDGSITRPIDITVSRLAPLATGSFNYHIEDNAGSTVASGTGQFGQQLNPKPQLPYTGNNYSFIMDVGADNNCVTQAQTINIPKATYSVSPDNPTGIYEVCDIASPLSVVLTAGINTSCIVDGNQHHFLVTLNDSTIFNDSGVNNVLTLNNVALGNYQVTATSTDAGFETCTATTSFVVRKNSMVVEVIPTDPTCNDPLNLNPDGRAIASVTGGIPPYKYEWFVGANVDITTASPISILSEVTGLSSGSYTLAVTDSKCSVPDIKEFTLNEAPPVGNIVVTQPDSACIVWAELTNADTTRGSFTFFWIALEERSRPVVIDSVDAAGNPVFGFEEILEIIENTVYVENVSPDVNGNIISTSSSLVIPSGDYIIRVQDRFGCTIQDSVTIQTPVDNRPPYQLCFRWTTDPQLIPAPAGGDPAPTLISLMAQDIINGLEDQIERCITNRMAELDAVIAQTCADPDKVNDELIFNYDVNQEHYTLYYYGRGGNLLKTIPPEGVIVDATRDRSVVAVHNLPTTYEYNSLGQLVTQNSPDGGATNFVYNDLGQLRFSQNAKQADLSDDGETFSYTKYDALGRILQVGESQLGVAYTAPDGSTYPASTFSDLQNDTIANLDKQFYAANQAGSLLYPDRDQVYPTPAQTLTEQTNTYYTESTTQADYFGKPQTYLRNRVSFVETFNLNGDRAVTYYSYDPHGNVKWLIQDIPGLRKNYLAYDYDLISGNVLKVKYNEGLNDAFYHKYDYDEDNRLLAAYTSTDNMLWDRDAQYEYYQHGPLKRTVMGQDRVQGMDYTYTIHGWLKAINHPDIENIDPGNDGDANLTGKDAFGMTLGYYDGDFSANGSPFNSTHPSHLSGTELFNGNISSWTSGTYAPGDPNATNGYLAISGRTFGYDKLNRIKESQFNTFSGAWTGQLTFASNYSYDANGNITNLQRRNDQDALIDDLTYNYNITQNNRLNHVSDVIADAVNNEDIDNQTVGNYTYDAIGNLVGDTQEDITRIDWTVYGKVSQIVKNIAGQDRITRFQYDAAGNRVKKSNEDAGGNITNTYYVRDASGNIMAIYDDAREDFAGGHDIVYKLREQPVYGSDRLGQRNADYEVSRMRHEDGLPPAEVVTGLEFNAALKNWLLPVTSAEGSALAQLDMTNAPLLSGITAPIGLGDLQQIAVAEDDNGNLLFSLAVARSLHGSKGKVVLILDKDGHIMPGTITKVTDQLKADPGGQSLIAKTLEDGMKYKIFTIDRDHKVYVHTVDMSAVGNGSAGDPKGTVVRKNEPLDNTFNFVNAMTLMEDRQFECPIINVYMIGYDPDAAAGGPTTMSLRHYAIAGTSVSSNTMDSWEGYNSYGQVQLSKDAGKLAVVTPQGQPLGWYNATNEGAELRVYDINILENTVGSAKVIDLGDDLAVNSVDYSADNNFVYYTASSPETGHQVNRVDVVTPAAVPETLTGLNNYSQLRRGNNDNLYVTEANGQLLTRIVHDVTTPVISSVDLSLDAAYSLTGVMPAQPLSLTQMGVVPNVFTRELGKYYELKDHLGNVRAVVSDRLATEISGANIINFKSDFISYTDYYPFGMQMPGRSLNSTDYRYGFNGKEKDQSGEFGLTAYDYGFRIYNPAIGKFLSVDPLTYDYPWYSSYQFAGNMPIWAIDLDGLEEEIIITAPTYKYQPVIDAPTGFDGTINAMHNTLIFVPNVVFKAWNGLAGGINWTIGVFNGTEENISGVDLTGAIGDDIAQDAELFADDPGTYLYNTFTTLENYEGVVDLFIGKNFLRRVLKPDVNDLNIRKLDVAPTNVVPRGFSSADEFAQVGAELKAALNKSGIGFKNIGVRGSAVTNASSKGGGFRIAAQNGLSTSDIDVFVELSSNIGISSSKNIKGFIHPQKLFKKYPELQKWSEKWSKTLGREITPGAFKPDTFTDKNIITF